MLAAESISPATASTGPVSTASSAIGPQSCACRVSGVDAGLGPRRFASFGATALPKRSRAGPEGAGGAVIGERRGTCAITASSNSVALAARASRST